MKRKLSIRICTTCGSNEDNCMCDNPEYDTKEFDMRSRKEKEEDKLTLNSGETSSVRQCHICGKAAHLCTCNDEDFEDDGETVEDDVYLDNEQDVDAFGRNYSDADPGL